VWGARGGAADFDAQRLADEALEFCRVTRRGPHLQFRVARRPQLQQRVVAPIVDVEAGDRLRMAAVEALGQPENRGERADGFPPLAPEVAVVVVPSSGRRLTMIARHQGDDFDFLGLETP
jgi:hypothetical protein